MKPEPENIVDPEAISFQCLHNGVWRTIGYVVSEICEEVHTAIKQGDIIISSRVRVGKIQALEETAWLLCLYWSHSERRMVDKG